MGRPLNFLELGSEPALVLKIFHQIARTFGQDLQPTAIYNEPTVGTMAQILDKPSAPPFSPLILLKPGDVGPPIFLAHGLGSSVMEFSDLVRHLRTLRPIYGLQAKGSDGASSPLTRIEGMAQFHINAIRNIQPHGPYTLIGYSLGGIVAFEMARQLSVSGEKVALVAMIDSYPWLDPLGFWRSFDLGITQVKYRMSDFVRSKISGATPVPLNRMRERIRFSDFLALVRYRPRFHNGKVLFFLAANSHYPRSAVVWPRFTAEFSVEVVPGNHYTVLSEHSQDLAAQLSSAVESGA